MRALVIANPGENSALEWRTLPTPEPSEGEILVQVATVGVANTDLLARQGFFGPNPPVPGIDVAGTVLALGEGTSRLRVGDRVVLNPAITCGQCVHCLRGDHGTCRSRRALGQALDGGYAELVRIPEQNALLLANSVPFEQAATIPSNFCTAWQMLFARGRVRPGDAILVTGAAGGVGSALVKIGCMAGMRVIGTVGSAGKAAAVRDWGAALVLDHEDESLVAQTKELTGGIGVAAIMDTVGAAMWDRLIPALAAGGRLITCSANGGLAATVSLADLLGRQLSIIGTGGSGSKSIAARVVDMFNQGLLAGHVAQTLPIGEAEKAHQMFRDRQIIGKLVLRF